MSDQQQSLTRKTMQDTVLWSPSMFTLLHKAIHADSPAMRERYLMQLLRKYTNTLDDPTQKRWIEVK